MSRMIIRDRSDSDNSEQNGSQSDHGQECIDRDSRNLSQKSLNLNSSNHDPDHILSRSIDRRLLLLNSFVKNEIQKEVAKAISSTRDGQLVQSDSLTNDTLKKKIKRLPRPRIEITRNSFDSRDAATHESNHDTSANYNSTKHLSEISLKRHNLACARDCL